MTLVPRPLGEEELSLFPGADKLAHFFMFAFLTVILMLDRQRKNQWLKVTTFFCVCMILLSSAIGVGIEFLQQAMGLGRSFEVYDIVSDVVGSVLGGLAWMLLQKRWSESDGTVRSEESGKEKHISDGDTEDSTDDANRPQSGKSEPLAARIKRWWMVPVKVAGWILVVMLMIPVLIYIPPVQTFLKDMACMVVSKSTGMKIEIGRFRLKFPVDVALEQVLIRDVAGDTMACARKAIADVKLLPLISLDVKINKLDLVDGYYRMVSPDSSMIMRIKAGNLTVDGKSSANIRSSEILVNKAIMKNGSVSLYMNVWKKKPAPDSSSTPFLIRANELKLENFTFAMSMLPTIDTLNFRTKELKLLGGEVDLRKNIVTAAYLGACKGAVTYLTPTPEYIKSHPVPADTVSPPSPPMIIRGDSIMLADFEALYGVKGMKPMKGFDPNYIHVSELNLGLSDFFNKASSIRLPIYKISANERSGLAITSGHGIVSVDSVGLSIEDFHINTLHSKIYADADIPFALMEMKPDARMNIKAEAGIGKHDIGCFMPQYDKYLSLISSSRRIALILDASGSLTDLDIPVLNCDIPDVISLAAKGHVKNPLKIKQMTGHVAFDGKLTGPKVINKLTGMKEFEIPALQISGTAEADHESYSADFDLRTSAGDLAANGRVSLNSEVYEADIEIDDFDVARFMPSTGISGLTASVRAEGTGFNPSLTHAASRIEIDIPSVSYKGHLLNDIRAYMELSEGAYTLDLVSPNQLADLDITASGKIAPDDYTVDLRARINHLDLYALGVTPEMNSGNADFYLSGSASPGKWLYDLDLKVNNFDWNTEDRFIRLPEALQAKLLAQENYTELHALSDKTVLNFYGQSGLKGLIDSFSSVSESVNRQLVQRRLDVEELSAKLPRFNLEVNASGNGLIRQFLIASGMNVDTVHANFAKDSLISGNLALLGLKTGKMQLDTITFGLQERNSLLDYKLHLGNAPGTLDEFAVVNMSGYVGGNRASLFLNQKNIAGETGYRLGLTAALSDSTISVHFSPLNATIAYMPWRMNADNHIDYAFDGSNIDANLTAKSKESSIMMQTEPMANGDKVFHFNLENIHIEDFLRMSALAPPLTASIDSDLKIRIHDKAILGNGGIQIKDLTYDKMRVGNFDMDFKAGMGSKGASGGMASLKVNGKQAMVLRGVLRPDSLGVRPENVRLSLTQFPLSVANAFLGKDVASLRGSLNGEMKLDGTFKKPVLNGNIACDSVSVYIPMIGSALKFDNDPISVVDNVLDFNTFNVWGVNGNPVILDGIVNAVDFGNIFFDLTMKGKNVQLLGNDRRAKSQIYGKLFIDVDASARGPMRHFDVNANLSVLNSTDITYQLQTDASVAIQQRQDEELVKFVQFSDTTTVSRSDSIQQSMSMRIMANLNLRSGMQATVLLSGNGTDRVQLTPSGLLNYFQNYMGDMRLNGQLNLGDGFVRYSIPVVGEKKFDFEPNSNVLWNGDIMNPVLNIAAKDNMKVNVKQSGGNTHLVNFDVSLDVTNTLSSPKIMFDLSAQDDLTVQNELQSMSPDQRSQQAINLLLYGQYTGPGVKTASASNIAGTALYGFLTSQINSWAAKNIRGVDLSFGVDQYDKSVNGQNTTTTSYSYQVSKSLFNNKFKIVVGGNYSTDASAEDNFAQNLLSNISFEYMLRQTNTQSIYLKLFRHNDFESIVEGEVTETGVGFVMRRRMSNLKQFFRFRRRKKKENTIEKKDSVGISLPVKNESLK